MRPFWPNDGHHKQTPWKYINILNFWHFLCNLTSWLHTSRLGQATQKYPFPPSLTNQHTEQAISLATPKTSLPLSWIEYSRFTESFFPLLPAKTYGLSTRSNSLIYITTTAYPPSTNNYTNMHAALEPLTNSFFPYHIELPLRLYLWSQSSGKPVSIFLKTEFNSESVRVLPFYF